MSNININIKHVTFLSFQIIAVTSPVLVVTICWILQRMFSTGPEFILFLLITTLVFYLSLDWYFWCMVKKVYNNTKNNRDIILLTEIEHVGIDRHCHTI